MGIRKERMRANYTQIGNDFILDKNVSLSAKGLMCVLCILPEDWNVTSLGLATMIGVSVKSVRKYLSELEGAGYLARTRRLSEKCLQSHIDYEIAFSSAGERKTGGSSHGNAASGEGVKDEQYKIYKDTKGEKYKKEKNNIKGEKDPSKMSAEELYRYYNRDDGFFN